MRQDFRLQLTVQTCINCTTIESIYFCQSNRLLWHNPRCWVIMQCLTSSYSHTCQNMFHPFTVVPAWMNDRVLDNCIKETYNVTIRNTLSSISVKGSTAIQNLYTCWEWQYTFRHSIVKVNLRTYACTGI